MKLARVIPQTDGLEATWADGSVEIMPWMWLRENCRCVACWDARSGQRNVFTAALPADIAAATAEVLDSGGGLRIVWDGDGHASHWPAESLAPDAGDPRPPAETWDAAGLAASPPTIAFDEATGSDAGLARMLRMIAERGFAHVLAAPADMNATRALATRIGYVRETLFGGLWSFEANAAMADSAYSDAELRPHTDATYSEDAPGLQILHCLAYDATGGESVMVDGFRIVERLRTEAPDALATLTRIPVTGRYVGDGAWLEATRPAIRLDAAGSPAQVSFNNYDRAPVRPPEGEAAAFYAAIAAFDRIANDPAMQWRRVLRPGEMLAFDNWRILHGRGAFVGGRRMAGCYINREDWLSRMRVLADRVMRSPHHRRSPLP